MSVAARPLPGGGEARAARTRVLVGGGVVALASAYAMTLVATQEPLVAAPLAATLVVLLVLARPIAGLYLLFAAALLLEQFEITGLAPITAQTHVFENLSTWSAIPLRLSLSDLLAVLTLVSWALRRIVAANEPFRAGPLKWAVAAYAGSFALGAIIGASRGGGWDPIITLAEARGGLYLCLLYVLTVNLVRDRAQVMTLLWEFVVIVGIKALQGVGNYLDAVNAGYVLEAVTGHEDVVFFDVAITLAIIMLALRARSRLFYVLVALLPVIVTAEMLTQRRSAFAALAAALVIVAVMSAVERPRVTLVAIGVVLAFGAAYSALLWNSSSRLAEPVRFVKEIVDPSALSWRDQSSDAWREIENSNIAYTVRQFPLTGVGLGQEYLFAQEPPALTNFVYWRYIAHNALLWLWLKAGPYGAFAFWFLVVQIVMRGLRLYRRLDDPFLRAAAAFPVLLTVAQVVFSSVDLGLTYNRTMTVLGVAAGLMAPLRAWVSERDPRARRRAATAVDGGGTSRRAAPMLAPVLRIVDAGIAPPPATLRAGIDQRERDVCALCDGAAVLSRHDNKVAQLALLWAAVGIAPSHLRAHRSLAATLANCGDVDAAAEEHARYIELMLRAGDYRRAALELLYARSSIGDHPPLTKVAERHLLLAPLAASLAPAGPLPSVPRLAGSDRLLSHPGFDRVDPAV